MLAKPTRWWLGFILFLLGSQLATWPVTRAAPLADTPICYNLVSNGGFEEGSNRWRITDSTRPAEPTGDLVFEGVKAMRVGNAENLPNVQSESEIRSQPIFLPANATSIVLRFQYYPARLPVPAEDKDQDLQQAMIYQVYDANDPKKDQLIESVFNVQENDRVWKARELPLSNYKGKTISIVFRVKNDGAQGSTLMFVDKVEIWYCTFTPIPTSTATYTPTATPTGTATVTSIAPTATATASPPVATTPAPQSTLMPCFTPPPNSACYNLVANGGFEYDGDWYIGEDPIPPRPVWDQHHSGSRAMLLGNPPGGPNVNSYSSVRQVVAIPANAIQAQLCFWRYDRSEEPALPQPGPNNDRQEVMLLEPDPDVIAILDRQLRNGSGWVQQGIPLDAYRGRAVNIYFNVYNNSSPQHTWMYLDDVEVQYCTAAPPLPPPATAVPATNTPLPTFTATTVVSATQAPLSMAAVTETPIPFVEPTLAPSGAVVVVVTPLNATTANQRQSQLSAMSATVTPIPLLPTVTVSGWRLWLNRLGALAILLGILVVVGFLFMAIWRLLRPRYDLYE